MPAQVRVVTPSTGTVIVVVVPVGHIIIMSLDFLLLNPVHLKHVPDLSEQGTNLDKFIITVPEPDISISQYDCHRRMVEFAMDKSTNLCKDLGAGQPGIDHERFELP